MQMVKNMAKTAQDFVTGLKHAADKNRKLSTRSRLNQRFGWLCPRKNQTSAKLVRQSGWWLHTSIHIEQTWNFLELLKRTEFCSQQAQSSEDKGDDFVNQTTWSQSQNGTFLLKSITKIICCIWKNDNYWDKKTFTWKKCNIHMMDRPFIGTWILWRCLYKARLSCKFKLCNVEKNSKDDILLLHQQDQV